MKNTTNDITTWKMIKCQFGIYLAKSDILKSGFVDDDDNKQCTLIDRKDKGVIYRKAIQMDWLEFYSMRSADFVIK